MTHEEKANYIYDRIAVHRMGYPWLVLRLAEQGIATDRIALCQAIRLHRTGPVYQNLINQSFNIVREYEEKLGLKKEGSTHGSQESPAIHS